MSRITPQNGSQKGGGCLGGAAVREGEEGGRMKMCVCLGQEWAVGRRRKEVHVQEEKLQILSTYVQLGSQHQQP